MIPNLEDHIGIICKKNSVKLNSLIIASGYMNLFKGIL